MDPVTPSSVSVMPELLEVAAWTSTFLQLEVRGPDGSVIEPVSVVWTSSNSEGVVVTGAGEVTGIIAGTEAVVTASVEGVEGSATVRVVAGAPHQLVVVQQPNNGDGLANTARSGVPFLHPAGVHVRDAAGNVATVPGVTVTARVLEGEGNVALGASAVTGPDGVAVFPDLVVEGLVGRYRLVFESPGLRAGPTLPITLSAGPAARIIVEGGVPTSTRVAMPFPSAPRTSLTDKAGNPVFDEGVQIEVALEGGGALLENTLAHTDESGQSLFSDLIMVGLVGEYRVRFQSEGLEPAVSSSFLLTPGEPAFVAIEADAPAQVRVGDPISPSPAGRLADVAGNTVPQEGVTLRLSVANHPVVDSAQYGAGREIPPYIENGLAVTDAEGVARFPDMVVLAIVGSYLLRISGEGLEPALTRSVQVVPGDPARLTLEVPPTNRMIRAQALEVQPVIQVGDRAGNPVVEGEATVRAELREGGGTVLNGEAVTNSEGKVVFSGLAVDGPLGEYVIRFVSAGLEPILSNSILMGSGLPELVEIVTQPGSLARSGITLSPQPVLQLRDLVGNPARQAGMQLVAVVVTGPATASQAVATSDAEGRVRFIGLTVTGTVGDYRLRFQGAGLEPAISNSVALTGGLPATLELMEQPGIEAVNGGAFGVPPMLRLSDSAGNPVQQAGTLVTASLVSGAGSLASSSVRTNSEGVAWFLGLRINGIPGASYQLSFSSPGLPSVTASTQTYLMLGEGVFRDEHYCTAPNAVLRMDLYVPPASVSRRLKTAVYMHGGGWISGDKIGGRIFRAGRDELLERGYLVVSLGYRLAGGGNNMWPSQIHDVKCAIRHLRTNAQLYGLDPAKIAAWGESAGGHLALLLGTSAGVSAFEGAHGFTGIPSNVQAAASLAGISDLTNAGELNFPGPEETFATWPDPNSVELSMASPVTQAGSGDAPTILFHGNMDGAVLSAQSMRLRDRLQASGVPVTFREVMNGSHGFLASPSGAVMSPSLTAIMNEMVNFFDLHLK